MTTKYFALFLQYILACIIKKDTELGYLSKNSTLKKLIIRNIKASNE